VIIVELLEPAGGRGFLPESHYHDYAGRDINAARARDAFRMVPWRHPHGEWTYAV